MEGTVGTLAVNGVNLDITSDFGYKCKVASYSPASDRSWSRHPAFLVVLGAALGGIPAFAIHHVDKADAVDDTVLTSRIDSELDKKLKDVALAQMSSDISSLKGQVSQLNSNFAIILNRELKQVSALPKNSFRQAVPKLADSINVAAEIHAKVEPDTVRDVRLRLVADNSDTNAYWNAVTGIIALRSPAQTKQLKPCSQTPDSAISLEPMTTTSTRIKVAPAYFNCRLDLSHGGPGLGPFTLGPGPVRCVRCQIYYSGKESPLLEAARSIIFLNCSFDIRVEQDSPENGKLLASAILNASDQANISFALHS